MKPFAPIVLVGAVLAGLAGAPAQAQGTRLINRTDYAEQLRGMWLGQCIANWTGLRSEGKVNDPPFPTDADWGRDLGGGPLQFVLDQDPWLADDDTDVEYVALHLLDTLNASELTGEQLAAGWLAHMDDAYLWVSNRQALDLMRRGVVPPATSLPAANIYWLRIDAQLTTEFFGAMSPGMVGEAMAMADIPILNTARGHAAHAAQTFMLFYCLASQADRDLPPAEQTVWLVTEARRYLPDTSKAADIVDFVLADYLANPDKNDWERTRDLVYQRYQLNAGSNGFKYRGWTESSVNFASGLIALLYGGGDFLRTVQIGTLTGWDSDNGTATMGGLLGLLLGHEGLVEQIRLTYPGYTPADRYNIERTRDNLPNHLDGDPEAQDSFTLMAERMVGVINRRVAAAGGLIDPTKDFWLIPPSHPVATPRLSPRHDLFLRSANCQVPRDGGTVTAWSSVTSAPPPGYGSGARVRFANGFELDDSGADVLSDAGAQYYSTLGAGQVPGDPIELRVTYNRPVTAASVVLIEGDHFDAGEHPGGHFASTPTVELLIGGVWTTPPGGFSHIPAPDPTVPFEILGWTLAQPVQATGVRVLGTVGGSAGFVTCAELDLLGPSEIPSHPSFDVDANGTVGVDDIYRWHLEPVDFLGDGDAGRDDLRYLLAAVRWRELEDMSFWGGKP
jgi:hypothetical protein